ncbi:phytanoyl-CoA dioxygenase family protein [Litorimonas sp. WD9-15]|uniref:phytanoyl-CoA dioxygenase family protein n=1 Tax=Litorimonas sp. WD9-15 TaxID=3418716 RepID=UPI003D0774FD
MRATLKHVSTDTPVSEIMEIINSDGGVIIDAILSPEEVQVFADELAPLLDKAAAGQDSFSGFSTTRVGALIARSSICRKIATNTQLLEIADAMLGPFSPTVQLSLTQAVNIAQGEGAQILHRDRGLWGGHIPRRIETQLGTMIAVTDFTHENGATRVVLGSATWDAKRQPEPHEIASAEMKAGSILVYNGTVIHGGGPNATNIPRLGVLLHYTLGWLRQQENMYLSCPPEIAKTFTPKLRRLLGYTQGSPVMGFYSDPYNSGTETASPETLFGDVVSAVGQRASGEDVVSRTTGKKT